MTKTTILIIVLLFNNHLKNQTVLLNIEPSTKLNAIQINRQNIKDVDEAVILAAIAEHECGSLSKEERYYIMETAYNRALDNFSNHGTKLYQQIVAPKQFTGLFKYRPEAFCFDPNIKRHLENLQMAKLIIKGHRKIDKCTYYWAGTCDKNTSHYRWLIKRKVNLPNIKHIIG